jgi:hypothetical protein
MLNFVRKVTSRRSVHPFVHDFEEASFSTEMQVFGDAMRRDIADINDSTQWTEALFEPLEADVEVQRSDGPQRQVRDLMTAIRSDSISRTFLVLGEPGSGKSVALRKLALDLLNDARRSGRLPIYINLKEWRVEDTAGSEKSRSLYDFVFTHLHERYNVVAAQFLDRYFKRLYHGGHIFFILDSFDEIPEIMDATERSDRLREISRSVFELIQAPGHTQGVIASRYFKKPALAGQSVTTLDIRPFTETKIRGPLERTRRFPPAMLRELFADRPDLVGLAQNPFSATMLARYVHDNNGLPVRQSDLFASTIADRLERASDWLRRASLVRADLEVGATSIAFEMFRRPDIGLDATAADLAGVEVPGGSVERLMDALAYTRIGRFSPGPERRFSFVHRRFNEYFLVRKLLETPTIVSLEAIPTDNRWRDTLILYCEVASEEEAVRIANFCWERLSLLDERRQLADSERSAAVQCLRFLADAFANRQSAIAHLQHNILSTILGALERAHTQKASDGFDVIFVKLLVEAVGLLPLEEIGRALQLAVNLDHAWISQTALRSCRGLQQIDPAIERGLARTLVAIPTDELIRRRQELSFSLSISDTFRPLRGLLISRYRSAVRLRATMPILAILGLIPTLSAWIYALWHDARLRHHDRADQTVQQLDDLWSFRVAFLNVFFFPIAFIVAVMVYQLQRILFGLYWSAGTPLTVEESFQVIGSLMVSVTTTPLAVLAGYLPSTIHLIFDGQALRYIIFTWRTGSPC